jgi:methyltransferase family protein
MLAFDYQLQLAEPKKIEKILYIHSTKNPQSSTLYKRLKELYPGAEIYILKTKNSSLGNIDLTDVKVFEGGESLIPSDYSQIQNGKELLDGEIDLVFFGVNNEVEWDDIRPTSQIKESYNNLFDLVWSLNLYDWTCIVDKQFCVYYPYNFEDYRGKPELWEKDEVVFHLPVTLLTVREREKLFDLARCGPCQGAIVNIGHFNGGSSIILAKASKLARREKVFSFDIDDSQYHSSLEYLDKNQVEDWLIFQHQASVEASQNWSQKEDSGIRLLFIDGDHTYEGCKNDIESWAKYLVPGGVIAIHDYGNVNLEEHPSAIINAVHDAILTTGKFSNIECIGTLFLATKTG